MAESPLWKCGFQRIITGLVALTSLEPGRLARPVPFLLQIHF
jgi:hypothetical protein